MTRKIPDIEKCKICIIGLGYVGLPLAIEFSKQQKDDEFISKNINRKVIGFDIDIERVTELNNFTDRTREVKIGLLKNLKNLQFSYKEDEIADSDVFIVTVPSPIDNSKNPDLSFLKSAIYLITRALKSEKGNNNKNSKFIIVESTVYPGFTEEICVPIIEKETNLILNKDFFMGYSPERINPGDKEHRIDTIVKITSGSDSLSSDWIDKLYKTIIKVGTCKAENIKVAEAAKVIENIQRDINISLMNELNILFNKLNINTLDVLRCSGTKWNFLPFKPGLVGGHCISVDPYYLTYKAKQVNHNPEVILSGRRINDYMATWYSQQIIRKIANNGLVIKNLKILLMGFTFKENCPDFRNTKILDLYNDLSTFGAKPIVYEPNINPIKIKENLKINIQSKKEVFENKFEVIVVALAHDQFKEMSLNDWNKITSLDCLIFDLKGFIPKNLKPIIL